MKCRACFSEKLHEFVDLGPQPASNDYQSTPSVGQKIFPLRVLVCEDCGLGQVADDLPPDSIFSDYMYFSSMSPSWVEDRRKFAHRMINEFNLDGRSLVIDIGSNDGYLLKHFVEKGVSVQGWEPAANVAAVAVENAVPTRTEFWNARNHGHEADLITATNVLAHTPDMDGFIAGIAAALRPVGTAALEFPLFSNLIKHNQLDTIYHEHYSYISVAALQQVLRRHELRIWRIEELASHGGSVRVFACKSQARYLEEESVSRVRNTETWAPSVYFPASAEKVKWDLLDFLAQARHEPGPVIGYGAPAKATVLANYVGLNSDSIPFTIDDSPYKQGKYVPGTNIKIEPFDTLDMWMLPAYFLVFPWNLLEPIRAKLLKKYEQVPANLRPRLVTAIPHLTVTNL